MLLCDFHIHTNYSDGTLDLRETVDLYGQAGFDVIAITDHVVNNDNLIGEFTCRLNLSIKEENFEDYLAAIRMEAWRAWIKYGMLVIPGVEVSKNYLSSERSAHLLILDVKEFISACGDFKDIFHEAKRQNALTIACHPHHTQDLIRMDTLFLYNHCDQYAKDIDAWEIANRNELFNVISLKKFPYIAGSDFHQPHHLYSWKTLLNCEKNVEAVKNCIRYNRGVGLLLFRS